jgi:hypothetical protein
MAAVFDELIEDLGLKNVEAPVLFRSQQELESQTRLFPYAHLVRRAWDTLDLDGVYCVDRRPTVYFKQVQRIDEQKLAEWHRLVWNQGLATILLVASPSHIRIYSGMAAPKGKINNQPEDLSLVEVLNRASDLLEIKQLIGRVETGRYYRDHDQYFQQARSVDQVLLDNLSAARDLLHDSGQGMSLSVAHALLGRIIFTCYLADRGIITPKDFVDIGAPASVKTLGQLLELPLRQARKCLFDLFALLKDHFNGSMFDEVALNHAGQLGEPHLRMLRRFLAGEQLRTGQLTFEFWIYNFKVIPVETISAIYEDFLAKEDHSGKKKSGAFYTPKHLAEMVVDLAIEGFDTLRGKTIVDPACGSGIFLVVLFNRIAEEWRRENPRAWNDTRAKKLREVLTKQLCGVDVNETACRIACFSLYLAFLDHLEPREIRQLHEDGGKVLPNLLTLKTQSGIESGWRAILEGSFFDSTVSLPEFDLLIGNPPWVGRGSLDKEALNWCLSKENPALASAPKDKSIQKRRFMPQDQIAHAFMWKAPVHLKPGGQGCLLLPSKVLINRTDDFQASWFQYVRAERIVLLSDFRRILFEHAISPAVIIRFHKRTQDFQFDETIDFSAPKVSKTDPRRGAITVFPDDRRQLELRRLISFARDGRAPVFWKQETWATPRDEEFLLRLSEMISLGSVIKERKWMEGQGIQPKSTEKTSKTPWWKPTDSFISARSTALNGFLLKDDCEPVGNKFPLLNRDRSDNKQLFLQPKIFINQGYTKIGYADFPIIFQDSLQAIAAPKKDEHLLKFLFALLRSRLAHYYFFHTAANLGQERDKVHFFEVFRLPFPLPEDSADPTKSTLIMQKLSHLFDQHLLLSQKNFLARLNIIQNFDALAEPLLFDYFGITAQERILIHDTLETLKPSITPDSCQALIPTLAKPSPEQRKAYADKITGAINKVAARSAYRVKASTILAPKVDLAIFCLEKVATNVSYNERDSFEDLTKALKRLTTVAPEQKGSFIQLQDIKVFRGNAIYILKPLALRAWTQTTALNDAQEIMAAVLNGN